MAEAKTKVTSVSLDEFLSSAVDASRHEDCRAIASLMQRATGEAPVMWGPSIVGFGRTLVAYADGKTAEWMLMGFSPRKAEFALYGLLEAESAVAMLSDLGKHKTGKSCLYVKRLSDIDVGVLERLVVTNVQAAARRVR